MILGRGMKSGLQREEKWKLLGYWGEKRIVGRNKSRNSSKKYKKMGTGAKECLHREISHKQLVFLPKRQKHKLEIQMKIKGKM